MKIDLIIMAGGNSRRFGRYKQIEPVTDNQETLLELAIKNSIAAGIHKVIIVTKKELEEPLITITKKFTNEIKIAIAIQDAGGFPVADKNFKARYPLGVGYALWTGTQITENDFVVMNGDDFYSKNALMLLISALNEKTADNVHFMIGYQLSNTLFEESVNVNRGICITTADHEIKIIEVANQISKTNSLVSGFLAGHHQSFSGNEITCMNLYGFRKSLVHDLKKYITKEIIFIAGNTKEITIHNMLNELIAGEKIVVKAILSAEKCLGLTNEEDLGKLKTHLNLHP